MITGEDPVCAEPKLFVGGLRFEVTQDELKAVFQQFGPLKSAALLTHPDTGRSKGCGMVLFGKWAHAEAAQLSLNNQVHELSNPRPLTVKFADPQRWVLSGGRVHTHACARACTSVAGCVHVCCRLLASFRVCVLT